MADIPNRAELEKQLAKELARLFQGVSGHLMELLEEYGYNIERIPASVWSGLTMQQKEVLLPFLESVAIASAERLAEASAISVEWTLVNQAAADWARGYSTILAGQIDATSREAIATGIRNSIASYFEEGLTMGQLRDRLNADPDIAKLFTKDVRDRLGRIYGPKRAEMISVTEVTRASMQGEVVIVDELAKQGIQMRAFWNTNNDELVCQICEPRNGIEKGKGAGDAYWIDENPAHPRCRCSISHQLPKAKP